MQACMNALEKYSHFKPQHNVFYEWYVSYSCEQNKGESIDNYSVHHSPSKACIVL